MVRHRRYETVAILSKIVFILISFSGMFSSFGYASEFKVLVVMSYETDFPWCVNVREGIESVLGKTFEIKYFHMDTKKDLAGGERKASEAYTLFKAFRPDGVIACDDNAQSMFVGPYLKNKVDTPVMFCGVNAEPEVYDYPAENVSGILERPHFSESIAFATQLVPSIKTFGFIIKDSPTGRAHLRQIEREHHTYSAKLSAFKMPNTASDVISATEELKKTSDVLFVAALAGVLDDEGTPLSEKAAVKLALRSFGDKPTIGDEEYTVRFGALCAVVRTGQEQGRTAAHMLVKAMRGTPVADIPISQNHRGKRIINATVLKTLGITPRPEILRGSELVRTQH